MCFREFDTEMCSVKDRLCVEQFAFQRKNTMLNGLFNLYFWLLVTEYSLCNDFCPTRLNMCSYKLNNHIQCLNNFILMESIQTCTAVLCCGERNSCKLCGVQMEKNSFVLFCHVVMHSSTKHKQIMLFWQFNFLQSFLKLLTSNKRRRKKSLVGRRDSSSQFWNCLSNWCQNEDCQCPLAEGNYTVYTNTNTLLELFCDHTKTDKKKLFAKLEFRYNAKTFLVELLRWLYIQYMQYKI